jgi:hypothetical protein
VRGAAAPERIARESTVGIRMRESDMLLRSLVSIQGRALYGHFRQFKVTTTEKTK